MPWNEETGLLGEVPCCCYVCEPEEGEKKPSKHMNKPVCVEEQHLVTLKVYHGGVWTALDYYGQGDWLGWSRGSCIYVHNVDSSTCKLVEFLGIACRMYKNECARWPRQAWYLIPGLPAPYGLRPIWRDSDVADMFYWGKKTHSTHVTVYFQDPSIERELVSLGVHYRLPVTIHTPPHDYEPFEKLREVAQSMIGDVRFGSKEWGLGELNGTKWYLSKDSTKKQLHARDFNLRGKAHRCLSNKARS